MYTYIYIFVGKHKINRKQIAKKSTTINADPRQMQEKQSQSKQMAASRIYTYTM